jgi:hypothetical protein
VALAGLALLRLYQPMSWDVFWELVLISQALVLFDNLLSTKVTKRMWRPCVPRNAEPATRLRRSQHGARRRRCRSNICAAATAAAR